MMNKYIVYAYKDGDCAEYASLNDKRGFCELVRAYCAQKQTLSDADKVFFKAVVQGVKVERNGFKKLMRALRAHDEVGLSNDIYDIVEEMSDDKKITALSLNILNGESTDLGEFTI